jgi:hypothetical protein
VAECPEWPGHAFTPEETMEQNESGKRTNQIEKTMDQIGKKVKRI